MYQLAVVHDFIQNHHLRLLQELSFPSVRRSVLEGTSLSDYVEADEAFYVEQGIVAEFVANDANNTLVCLCPSGSFAGLHLVPLSQRERCLVSVIPTVVQAIPQQLLRKNLARDGGSGH